MYLCVPLCTCRDEEIIMPDEHSGVVRRTTCEVRKHVIQGIPVLGHSGCGVGGRLTCSVE